MIYTFIIGMPLISIIDNWWELFGLDSDLELFA